MCLRIAKNATRQIIWNVSEFEKHCFSDEISVEDRLSIEKKIDAILKISRSVTNV